MSIEDLREQGVLLPEDEWGKHRLQTTVHQGPLLVTVVVAAASLVAAYLGDGTPLTWGGVAGFLVAFFAMVWICDRAIRRQRQRVENERDETTPDEPSEAASVEHS